MDLSFHQLTCALRKVLLWYPTRNLIGISNLVGVDVGGLVVVAYVNGPVAGRGRFWDKVGSDCGWDYLPVSTSFLFE